MRALSVPLVATLCAISFALLPIGTARASDEQHFLDFTDYSFGVVLISGNLTATVTHDMPQVIFKHSTDPVAPSFTVRLPLLYLYNDTNDDGLFSRSEAVYTASLDSHYGVSWITTPVEFANGPESGEYAQLRMNATLSLYGDLTDAAPSILDWANISFLFSIAENSVAYSNAFGSYTVPGRVAMKMDFTLDILKGLNFSGLAVEHLLKAGGSTNMFQIRESSGTGGWANTSVSSRVDEEEYGLNFTHKLNQTSLPVQEVDFAKEDGTIQAFYRYSSEPLVRTTGDYVPAVMNSSYYTTGAGLALHVAYAFSNDTSSLTQNSFFGIDESGFVGRVRDWLRENLPLIMVISGSAVAAIAFAVLASMMLHRRRHGHEEGSDATEEKASGEDLIRPK